MEPPTPPPTHEAPNDTKTICGAKRRDGGLCQKPPLIGATRCKIHNGGSEIGGKKWQTRMAEKAVALYGIAVDTSPTEALLDEVRRTAGHVAWLGRKISELGEDDLVEGVTTIEYNADGDRVSHKTKVAPSIWLDLYQRERRHLVNVAAAAIRANVDERYVRMAERQGELIAGAIEAVLGRLGLSEEQLAVAPMVVQQELLALTSGTAEEVPR